MDASNDTSNLKASFIEKKSDAFLQRYADQISSGCAEDAKNRKEKKVAWRLFSHDRTEVMHGSTPDVPGFVMGACKAKANFIMDDGSTQNLKEPSIPYILCCLLPRLTCCSICCFPKSLAIKGGLAILYTDDDSGESKLGVLAVGGANDALVDEAIAAAGLRNAGFTEDANGFWIPPPGSF